MQPTKQRNAGAMRRDGGALLLVLAALVALGLLALLLVQLERSTSPGMTATDVDRPTQEAGSTNSLVLYCAAGMRVPVEKIVAAYRDEYGVEVQIQYGGSNTLVNQIELARTGDLFLAADGSFLDLAREKGLLAESLPVANIRAVITVAEGNPKNIKGLADLLRDDVRTAVANPDQAAVGAVMRKALTAQDKWADLEQAVAQRGVFQATVNEVANTVKVGAADAGIVWDITVAADPQLSAIEMPELAKATGEVGLGVLVDSANPTAALRFARYFTAQDRGLQKFADAGFKVIEGDAWTDKPEITFFCGAVNRRAVEPLIQQFEQREGVRVNTVYNGCGILTGQMKVITDWQQGRGFPDTFMACDRYYLDVVKDQFQEAVELSETEVLIAVPKGNPLKITGLDDLKRPGLRVAVGQPKQCTIGVLTRELLKEQGILDDVLKNVVAETCSSALLLPMVITGSVDAAVVYETDTKAESEKISIVRLSSPKALAVQPLSLAKTSQYKWLTRRFMQFVMQNEEQFKSIGFRWRLGEDQTAAATDTAK
jgi:molybdenum ABC transporter molybdate-binding protein